MFETPDFPRGSRLTAEKLETLSDLLELMLRSRGSNASIGSCGFTEATPFPETFWVRVTDNDGGTPPAHGWVQIQENGPAVYIDMSDGMYGSTDEQPVYEINGLTIPANTYVRVWRGMGDYYCTLYERPGSGSSYIGLTSQTPSTVNLVDGGSVSAYPAQLWALVAGTWTVVADCWYVSPNGEVPPLYFPLLADQVGTGTDDKIVYSTQHLVASVKVTSLTTQTVGLTSGGTLTVYPAEIQLVIGGTWTDVATGWFYPLNSETPTLNKRYHCLALAKDTGGTVVWGTELYPLDPASTTFNYVADTFDYSSSCALNFANTTISYNAGNTIDVNNALTTNLAAATTWSWIGVNLSTSVLEYQNLTLNYNTVAVSLSASQSWSLTAGDTWTLTGGAGSIWAVSIPTLQFTATTVSIGNSGIWTWDSTTQTIFQGIFELCGYWILCWAGQVTVGNPSDPLANPAKPVLPVLGNNGILKGIAAPSPANPERITLINRDTLPFTVKNQAATSPSNGIATITGGDMPVPAGGTVVLDYDTTSSLWRVTGGNCLPTLTATDDTTPGYLKDKIVAGSNVTVTEISGGGGKQLQIAASSGSGTTGTNNIAYLSTNYTCTASFANAGLTLTLPSAGTYEIVCDVLAQGNFTGANNMILAQLFNSTASSAIATTTQTILWCGAANQIFQGGFTLRARLTVAGSTVINLQAKYQLGSGAVTTAALNYACLRYVQWS